MTIHQINSFKILSADSFVNSEISKETSQYKEHFKEEYFVYTQTFDEAIDVIDKTEKVILIVSGKNG